MAAELPNIRDIGLKAIVGEGEFNSLIDLPIPENTTNILRLIESNKDMINNDIKILIGGWNTDTGNNKTRFEDNYDIVINNDCDDYTIDKTNDKLIGLCIDILYNYRHLNIFEGKVSEIIFDVGVIDEILEVKSVSLVNKDKSPDDSLKEKKVRFHFLIKFLYKLLKPGGRLILPIVIYDGFKTSLYRYYMNFMLRNEETPLFSYVHTQRSIRNIPKKYMIPILNKELENSRSFFINRYTNKDSPIIQLPLDPEYEPDVGINKYISDKSYYIIVKIANAGAGSRKYYI